MTSLNLSFVLKFYIPPNVQFISTATGTDLLGNSAFIRVMCWYWQILAKSLKNGKN